MSTIAVVGGGIAGLAAAYRLSGKHDVVVFERETVAGGKIRSQKLDGFLFEWGPGAFLSSAVELQALIAELGIAGALTAAPPAAKNRFIYWDGKLHTLPTKPPGALKMSLLTPRGKLRAFRELFVAPGAPADDESVQAFVERRFGHEVAERLVAPALLGISGGDAAATNLAATFPRLRELERTHGSVLRGMMKGSRNAATLYTFASGGMQTLTDRLAERLGARLRSGTTVRSIARDEHGWQVGYDGGAMVAEGLIIATPAGAAADLVESVDPQLAAGLREIPYAPMRAVGVAFRAQDVPVPLDGFGFLAARKQGLRILGAFYTSSIVPEHAPPDTAYLRVFLGGATDPAIVTLDTGTVRDIVLADLRAALGITAPPVAYHEVVWPEAIPQYRLAHRALLAAIERREAGHPRFALAGNAYRGLGVGDTVRDAFAVAARVGDSVRPTTRV